MKTFKLWQGSAQKLVDLYIKNLGLDPVRYKNYIHPQEDFLFTSEKFGHEKSIIINFI